MSPKYTNDLIHETSPYLIQHAHNPVNWLPWKEHVLEEALKRDKLMIVSIGYSACHWCHVMEHESFEDEEVADLMNAHFTNIKVDREERPDIDQVYMAAVQLMTNGGGWPLNCICLPDGRPIYGGTYFPKDQWINILKNLVHLYNDDRKKVEDYADKLEEGIKNFELIDKNDDAVITVEDMEEMTMRWAKNFDNKEGGGNRAPKFPLPNNYEFLLKYAHLTDQSGIKKHVELTLNKMALGGIYDQVGGGFSRYSVDVLWKVPHFEKMLYDNGQLLHLYSLAYQTTNSQLYKDTVYQTIDWLEREMRDSSGAFYSALDADSEGEEGKFYTWTINEIKEALEPEEFSWAQKYYALDDRGKWEGKYILLRPQTDEIFAKKNGLELKEVHQMREQITTRLFEVRSKRIRPGLDDKSLTSWNAMTVKGLLSAYKAFGENEFLQLAKTNFNWWEKHQYQKEGNLLRNFKKGTSNIDGFLDDYAFSIEMLLAFYEVTFEMEYLKLARKLTAFTMDHFWDEERHMFFYTNKDSKKLITRKMEVNDNVIPASNSVMANNLFTLGTYFEDKDWKEKSNQMLKNVAEFIPTYGSGYSNWGMLALKTIFKHYELVMMGDEIKKEMSKVHEKFLPQITLAGGTDEHLPLMKNRKTNELTYYLCEDGACQLPQKTLDGILELLN